MNPGTTVEHIKQSIDNAAGGSPFLLQNETAYQDWREAKLRARQGCDATEVFHLDPDCTFSSSLQARLKRQLQANNLIFFETAGELDETGFLQLNQRFGLNQPDAEEGSDAVSRLRVLPDSDRRARYIPYTSRALNWHTDGYYYADTRRINAFVLYCVNQARSGGANFLFDHEIMYLLIRDHAPDLLDALMCSDLMQVPANIEAGRIIRAAQSGAVFSIGRKTGDLHMRYTSRPRNIQWKADQRSQHALNLIREILLDNDALVSLRLQNRQGVMCNNILHGREAFHDDVNTDARLFYRARYYDRLSPAQGMGLSRQA